MDRTEKKFILNYRDFTYSPFVDNRGEAGHSGQLLIATGKEHTACAGMKLIVKHTEPADAPNEFVAGYIADKLGLPNPKVYLFKPDIHSPFRCRYAVGIEYMEGLQKFEMSTLTLPQATDVILQTALTFLCFQEDMMQMNMWNGRIISYDYAESFSIENKHIRLCENIVDVEVDDVPAAVIIARERFRVHPFFAPDSALRILGWTEDRLDEVSKIYFDGLLPLLTLDQNALWDVMAEVLPPYVVAYYDICIEYMKQKLSSEIQKR